MVKFSSALKTDLYEFTMAAGYYQNKVKLNATFELFCYSAPVNRSYLIACGLEQAVDYLLNLRFSKEDIACLKAHPVLKFAKNGFFDYLKNFRFTGDLWAMPEGEVFFPLEPVIQIQAPIIEAQIVETYLLSIMHIQTLVATKASRVARAACSDGINRSVIDFGSRRAHGPEAAALAARAAYIGGCAGTSNVFAGMKFKIPTYGTMAHSWVEAFDTEEEAFLKYCHTFPSNSVLLIDTYDTIKGAHKAAGLRARIDGVRLDSGNLENLSKRTRKILDKAGLRGIKIVASGNLNEYKILDLVRKKSPIDIFGVGTDMVTSRDLPSIDIIYKLVQVRSADGIVKLKAKCSQQKETLPGRKQVYRIFTSKGRFAKDIISAFSERPPANSRRLLEPVIKNGRLVKRLPKITRIKDYVKEEVARLPLYCSDINRSRYMRVEISPRLRKLAKRICR